MDVFAENAAKVILLCQIDSASLCLFMENNYLCTRNSQTNRY